MCVKVQTWTYNFLEQKIYVHWTVQQNIIHFSILSDKRNPASLLHTYQVCGLGPWPRKSDRCGVLFYKNIVINKILRHSELYFTQYSKKEYKNFLFKIIAFILRGEKRDCQAVPFIIQRFLLVVRRRWWYQHRSRWRYHILHWLLQSAYRIRFF